ncbi:hypothetical protein GCM10009118_07600 [Wandonia haliotis]|uniref:Uncharacterized protein n=1 Tax=Wandonia haliotis TaxID=574963 RepID=A0ABN1MN37_9FLAO
MITWLKTGGIQLETNAINAKGVITHVYWSIDTKAINQRLIRKSYSIQLKDVVYEVLLES